jgi:4-hydroxy-4-methyl-2-oxoglutarate aldolase
MRAFAVAATLLAATTLTVSSQAQVLTLTRDQMIKYTAKNPYERFPDGRPKAPDALLEKVKDLSAEEVNISRQGFASQWTDGWHLLTPGKKLVGRALTLQLAPVRSDLSEPVNADWRAAGNTLPLNHQTVINMLQPGDVLVISAPGVVSLGGIIGDNLAYYIWKKTGAGFVIDGAIRDLEGIAPMGIPGYYRSALPQYTGVGIVMGINIPITVGGATVMPGDIVMGDREGVYFIPPQVAKAVVDEAEITHIHDEWTKMKFDQGGYLSTDIYSRPRDPKLVQEYEAYLKQKLGDQRYEEYRKRQAPPPAPARNQ